METSAALGETHLTSLCSHVSEPESVLEPSVTVEAQRRLSLYKIKDVMVNSKSYPCWI